MKALTLNPDEDGYEFVKDFLKKHPKDYKSILSSFKHASYLSDMHTKRKEISVWVLLEIVNFGQLLKILKY